MQPNPIPNPRAIQRVRHTASFRLLSVLRVTNLSASLRRVTLGGGDLHGFVSLSPDDHVKVFFFPRGTTVCKPANGVAGPDLAGRSRKAADA